MDCKERYKEFSMEGEYIVDDELEHDWIIHNLQDFIIKQCQWCRVTKDTSYGA